MSDLFTPALPLAPDVCLKHPFRRDVITGADDVTAALNTLAKTLPGPTERIETFRGEAAEATIWNLRGQPLQGCTLAFVTRGQVQELRLMLRPITAVRRWAEATRAVAPDGLWSVPDTIPRNRPFDPDAPVDPHLPFPVSRDAEFASPILTRKPKGAELVKTVIGHAAAIYGTRDLGPSLGDGATRVSYWTGSVEGLPTEMATRVTFNPAGELTQTTVFMQPLPVVELFRDHARHRLNGILNESYFEVANVSA